MLPPDLCPGARNSRVPHPELTKPGFSTNMLSERLVAAEYLRQAESQALQDAKAILSDTGLYADASSYPPTARSIFADVIKNRHYRDQVRLNRTYWSQETSYTYIELMTTISWELMDNTSAASILEIESVENFMQLLELAASCEGDFCAVRL
jgi:hypothetical protein